MSFYRLYCNHCGFNRVVDQPEQIEDLLEVKRSSIQNRLPFYDHEKNQKIESSIQKQPKQFKCPNCGYLVKPFKLKNITSEEGEKNNARSQY